MTQAKAGRRAGGLAARPNRASRRAERWRAATRTAGRLCLAYAGSYCLTTPQILLALVGGGLGRRQQVADAWARLWAMAPVRAWVAENVFGPGSGARFDGGDDRFAWVGQACWLAAAAAAAPAWATLDRRRADGTTWHAWFTLVVRLCLAGQMFYYGAAKAVPLQFQLPLAKLVEPFGNFSPMTVLWSQSAYSETYQRLLGGAEIAAGVLLTVPRTADLGAVVATAEMGQVFLLNMVFDVPVKIHSSHLLLLGLVLAAPGSTRIARAVLSSGAVPAARRPELFRSRRANQVATVAQVLAGAWLLGTQLRNDWRFWKDHGGGRAKPPLYGIWEVDAFSVDGRPVPPSTTDRERWRRLVVESVDAVTVQRMDDSLDAYAAAFDPDGATVTLLRPTDPHWRATLALRRPADDQLTLAGEVSGRQLRLRLHRLDLSSFPLVGRGFHWVQENAYWQ